MIPMRRPHSCAEGVLWTRTTRKKLLGNELCLSLGKRNFEDIDELLMDKFKPHGVDP